MSIINQFFQKTVMSQLLKRTVQKVPVFNVAMVTGSLSVQTNFKWNVL